LRTRIEGVAGNEELYGRGVKGDCTGLLVLAGRPR
jgi:hypothetical protein